MVAPIAAFRPKSQLGPGFTPANLFPVAYYTPYKISSNWQDAGASTPITTDAQLIYRIDDKSGNGYNLLQPTSAARFQWDATRGEACCPLSGSSPKMTASSVPYDRRNVAVMWVGRLTSSDPANYIWELGSLGLVAIIQNDIVTIWTGSSKTTTLHVPTERVFCLLVNASASGIDVYVNTVASKQTVTAAGVSSSTGFNLSGSGLAFGGVREVAVFGSTLSASDVSKLLSYANAQHGSYYAPASPTGVLAFDGDSITRGLGPTCNRSWVYKLNANSSWDIHNWAIVGQTSAQINADLSEMQYYANGTNWLFVWVGTNDLGVSSAATIESNISTYCNAAITAGYSKSKIVLFTLCTTNSTSRDTLNGLLRSNYTGYAGYLVDVAADSQLGVSGTVFNTPSLWADGAHPNESGAAAIAALVRSTVSGAPW